MEYERPSGIFKITGDWGVQSKRLKEKYPELTDSDLHFEEGKESELVFRISKKLRKKREAIVNLIQNFQATNSSQSIK
jgi:hypothetical protein